MSNPKDFSARQIRSSQLIASGGIAGTKAGLVIYSASIASDLMGGFTKDPNLLRDVGDDVYVFVSGSKNSKVSRGASNNGEQGVTLFGGDVVFSGTMYAERMVVEVDQTTTGSLLVSGSLFVSRSLFVNEGATINISSEGDSDNDFRVGSEDRSKIIYVKSATDKVGIGGPSSPLAALHIQSASTVDVLSNLADPRNYHLYMSTDANQQYGIGIGFRVGTSQNNVGAAIIHERKNNKSKGSLKFFTKRDQVSGVPPVLSLELDQNGRALFLSGGNPTDHDEHGYADMNFFVSGSAGSRGTSIPGTAVFGGDLFVSGSTIIERKDGVGAQGILFVGDGGTPASQMHILVSGSGGDTFGRITGTSIDKTTQLRCVWGVLDEATSIRHGDTAFIGGANATNLVLRSNNADRVVITAGATTDRTDGQVLILSGGNPTDHNEMGYTDINFFVSGSGGSKDGSKKGTSLFGGDLHISGNLSLGGSAAGLGWVDDGATVRLETSTDSVGIGTSSPGAKLEIESSNAEAQIAVLIDQDHTGASNALSITSAGTHPAIGIDSAKKCIAAEVTGDGYGLQINADDTCSTDSLVSFTHGDSSTTTTTLKVSQYGTGDILNLFDGSTEVFTVTGAGKVGLGTADPVGILDVKGDGTNNSRVFLLSGSGGPTSPNESSYSDVSFFVSGSKLSAGSSTGERGVSLFGGDVVISGSLNGGSPLQIGGYRSDLGTDVLSLFVAGGPTSRAVFDGDLVSSGAIVSEQGLSGSLTRLSDGTSFIVAGANINIVSASNGQVSISAPAAGDSAADVGWLAPGNSEISTTGSLAIGSSGSPTSTFTVSSTGSPAARISNISNDIVGGILRLSNTRGGNPGVNNDNVGAVDFWAPDSGTNDTRYAKIRSKILDATNGSESGELSFKVMAAGNQSAEPLVLLGDQVLVLSGGGPTSPNEMMYSDTIFFVSGSVGSQGTSTRGTSVFGGDVVVSGTIRSKQTHITHHSFGTTSTNRTYIPFAGVGDYSGTVVRYQNAWVPPFNGRLVKFLFRPWNNMNTEQITGSIHVSVDGDNQVTTTPLETVKKVIGVGANTPVSFAFTGSNHFAAGDWVAVSYWAPDGSGPGANGCNVTCVWELDTFI